MISQYSPIRFLASQIHPVTPGPHEPWPLHVTPFISHMTRNILIKSKNKDNSAHMIVMVVDAILKISLLTSRT